MAGPVKRKADQAPSPQKAKKARIDIPEYHLTPSRRDENGEIIWPAPKAQIERARAIIKECASSQAPTLLLPDKDADGLSAGAILHHTLTTLGLAPSHISVYFPPKGTSIHDSPALTALASYSPPPSYIFVLDQGSRKSGPLLSTPHTALIIDHHFATASSFPQGASVVTAHDCPPVATSALLTFEICAPLHPDLHDKLAWLAALGTYGDLGASIKWAPPFPDMSRTFAQHTKKAIQDAVACVNAPRRSAAFNVGDAWDAVRDAAGPEALCANDTLRAAQDEVKREVERWARTPPKFSRDATVAVLTVNSPAQIHPLVATRWAGFLQSKKLEVVICANEGYVPGRVHFSCRVAKSARARVGSEKVDIIEKLEGIVGDEPELRARLGESFARGHKEASGGIVGKAEWEGLSRLMGIGENVRVKKAEGGAKGAKKVQKNTLTNYFGKAK